MDTWQTQTYSTSFASKQEAVLMTDKNALKHTACLFVLLDPKKIDVSM
jgi:hypothetical protein